MKSFLTAVAIALGLTLATIGFSLWPTSAFSQMQQIPCSEADPTEHFLNRFGETVHAYGTSEAGAVLLRIYANLESGTWTVLMSRASPQTIHCVLSAGQAFDVVPPGDQPRPKGTSANYVRP